jgi:hypothetical protein
MEKFRPESGDAPGKQRRSQLLAARVVVCDPSAPNSEIIAIVPGNVSAN